MNFVMACISSVTCAQMQDAKVEDTNQSWNATTQYTAANTNPTRMTESHSKSGNRTYDKQNVEVLGPDGRYQPYLDTETETLQEDTMATHSIVRTYRTDVNGQRSLIQLTDEKTQHLAGEEVKLLRTTSNRDLNGNFQVVQLEVADTRKTAPDSRETKTTVYLNGGGDPAWQTDELQKRNSDGSVDVKNTVMLPDGNGGWQVGEVRESTMREEDKNRSSEDRISRRDSDGKLSEFSRTLVHESRANGQKTGTVETYSLDLPGVAREGNLRLSQRINSIEKTDSDGRTNEQQVEQPNPGDASGGLKVMTKMINIVISGASGIQETRTIEMRNPDGIFSIVSVDTRKSDQVPIIQEQIAPAENPK
jgi:hypothetical protein